MYMYLYKEAKIILVDNNTTQLEFDCLLQIVKNDSAIPFQHRRNCPKTDAKA